VPSELEKRLEKAKIKFQDKTRKEITRQFTIYINRNGQPKPIRVKKSKIEDSLRRISRGGIPLNAENFLKHFDDLSKYLPLCSAPKAFIQAWQIPDEYLDRETANKLANDGAQLIQINSKDKTERIFSHLEPGLELGKNKGLLFALRHKSGNYKDKFDKQGYFLYQPPTSVSGFFQYRWCQYLRENCDIPFIVLVIKWFRLQIRDKYNFVFVIAPAEILSKEEQKEVGGILKSKNDLKNLSKTLGRPLPLKIISRAEAYQLLYDLNTLDDENSEIENRRRLPPDVIDEWSFTKISKQNVTKLKKWAKDTGKKCPDGNICHNEPFDSIDFSKIDLGHIISQNWGQAFKIPLETIHHPDNLYLTCERCNSALNSNFPHKRLQQRIHGEKLTIGDWLRKHPSLLG